MQISESPGGTFEHPWGVGSGSSTYSHTGSNFYPLRVSRVYQKPAGTYTFYMEATIGSTTAAGGVVQTGFHYLVAKYFPTAYGTVETGG